MAQRRLMTRLRTHPVLRGWSHFSNLAVFCGSLSTGVLAAMLIGRWLLGQPPLPDGVTVLDLVITFIAVVTVPMLLGLVAGGLRYLNEGPDDEDDDYDDED